MFVVQATEGWHRWLSGVFSLRSAVDAYLAAVPESERAKHAIIDLGEMAYPLYVCDDGPGFRFLPEDQIVTELNRYAAEAKRDDDEWCYTNLYRIVGDWQPKRPGTDYMGALPHHHVTNSLLDWMKRDGFGALWE